MDFFRRLSARRRWAARGWGGAISGGVLMVCATASSCSTNLDCGLLGDCVNGSCICDRGWVGDYCTTLDLQPAPVDSGLRQQFSSNWCGTIIPDNETMQQYVMLSSDMHGCSLSVWLSGSQIIEAVSTTGPLGPYLPTGRVVVASEAHNPQAIQAPSGEWLLFDSYGGPDSDCPGTCNYTNCQSGAMCPVKMPRDGGLAWWVFHTAPTARGPWTPVNTTVDFPCYSQNLTPSPTFLPNGSLLLAFHCDSSGARKMGDLVLVRADDWRAGPFVRVADVAWRVCGNSSDANQCVGGFAPFLRGSCWGANDYRFSS